MSPMPIIQAAAAVGENVAATQNTVDGAEVARESAGASAQALAGAAREDEVPERQSVLNQQTAAGAGDEPISSSVDKIRSIERLRSMEDLCKERGGQGKIVAETIEEVCTGLD